MNLKSKHFATEQALMQFANENLEPYQVISIIRDVTNGDWIIFYK